jgi:hypothetical protein
MNLPVLGVILYPKEYNVKSFQEAVLKNHWTSPPITRSPFVT